VKEEEEIPAIVERFLKNGVAINTMNVKRPNLETLFLKLTGKNLREE